MENTLQFIEDLLSLVNKYINFKNKIQKSYPYHVNPIEELHANENANSRILCALLRYQVDGEFKILKSFINRFIPEIEFKISSKPVIEPEQYRIDISVRDKENGYALIFENKIHDAVLQKNQLATYIKRLKEKEDFDYNQIYVVFLTSSNSYETNDCCWYEHEECCDKCNGECSLKVIPKLREEFEKNGRYKKVTFRNDILPWLNEDVLPNLLYKERLLQASVILYTDYLKGLFNLRKENNMAEELENYIVNSLELTEKNLPEKMSIIKQKIEDIDELKKQMENIYNNYSKERFYAVEQKFKEINQRIADSKGLILDYQSKENCLFSIGFKKDYWDLSILVGCYNVGSPLFIYIGKHYEDYTIKTNYNITGWKYINGQHPYGWKYLEPFNFINLLEDIENKGDEYASVLEKELGNILKEIDERPDEIKMNIL